MPEPVGQVTPSPLDYNNKIGSLYESYIALHFRLNGWRVEKTRATGDFGADILVYDPHKSECDPIFAVQCKYWSSSIPVSAIQAISAAAKYYNAEVPIVLSNQEVTGPAKEMADKIGVLTGTIDVDDFEYTLPFPIKIMESPPPPPKESEPPPIPQKDYSSESPAAFIAIGFVVFLIIVVIVLALTSH